MHSKIISIPFSRASTPETETLVSIQTVSGRGTNVHLDDIEAARKSVNSVIPNEARACEQSACTVGIIVAQDSIDVICPYGQYACALNAARVVVDQIESAPVFST